MGAIVDILMTIEKAIFILVFASVICSWVSADPNNPIVQIIYKLTEPMYRPFRRFTSKLSNQIDLAPIAFILFTKVVFYFIFLFLQQAQTSFPVNG